MSSHDHKVEEMLTEDSNVETHTSKKSATATLSRVTKKSKRRSKSSSTVSEERKIYLVNGERFELDSFYQPIKKIGFGSYGVVCAAYDLRQDKPRRPGALTPVASSNSLSSTGSSDASTPTTYDDNWSSPSSPDPGSPSTLDRPIKRKKKVAIKKIMEIFANPMDAKRVLRELKLMRHFGDHPNIIKLLDMCPPRSPNEFADLYLVMEFMHSDLQKIIDGKVELSEEHLQSIVYQILRGVAYLHSGKVIHRDLKPGNILINNDCTVKITDFGLARGMLETKLDDASPRNDDSEDDYSMSDDDGMTEYVMTRWYRAPEVMVSSRHYDYAVDIWSVGCIFGELLNGQPLFRGQNYVEQLQQILKVLGTPADKDYAVFRNMDALKFVQTLEKMDRVPWERLCPKASPLALDLLSKLLVFNPAERITAADALEHPYLEKFRAMDPLKVPEKSCARQFDMTFEKLLRNDLHLKDLFFDEMSAFRPYVFYRKPSLVKRFNTNQKGAVDLVEEFTHSV